jgi:hypothetical protein
VAVGGVGQQLPFFRLQDGYVLSVGLPRSRDGSHDFGDAQVDNSTLGVPRVGRGLETGES